MAKAVGFVNAALLLPLLYLSYCSNALLLRYPRYHKHVQAGEIRPVSNKAFLQRHPEEENEKPADNPYSRMDWINKPIVARHERTKHLLAKFDTEKRPVMVPNKPNENKASKASNRKVPPDTHAAVLDAYETIFGIPREMMQQYDAGKGEDPCFFLPSANWERVLRKNGRSPRGSNLFLKGMGTFEVQGAYEKIVERQWRQHKEDLLQTAQDIPIGLAKIPVLTDLLCTNELDETFQRAMAKHSLVDRRRWIWKERLLEGGGYQGNELLDHTKRLPRELFPDNHPYWYVGIPHLWIQGYFPELFDTYDAPTLPKKYSDLQGAIVSSRKNRLDADKKNQYTRSLIALILMADEGGEMLSHVDLDPSYPREPRQHFIRYLDGWKQSLDSIDNLALLLHNPYAEQGLQLEWPPKGMAMTPNQLIYLVEKEIVQTLQYCHLADLPDTSNLKVLRSFADIGDAGDALENCATWQGDVYRYAKKTKEKECVLVAYMSENKKPIAMGLYRFGKSQNAGRWEDVRMAENKDASTEVREVYEQYSATIEHWCQHHLYPMIAPD